MLNMKIYKIAEIVENEILLTEKGKSRSLNISAILTNRHEVESPHPDFSWKIGVQIGKGSSTREVKLELPCLISTIDSLAEPLLIKNSPLAFFRNRIFMSEREPKSATEREEIVLRTKKAVYDEEAEIASIRAAVANMEAAIEFARSGPRRKSIPEDVKIVVWARDGGTCVRCGSNQNLHFDHIIPVVKGGASSEENIQLLCQTCNVKKADKIAIP
jgi:hypothetical protein